jgi:hypothetical protein
MYLFLSSKIKKWNSFVCYFLILLSLAFIAQTLSIEKQSTEGNNLELISRMLTAG